MSYEPGTLSRLEYLIKLRAISFKPNSCWIYLTPLQRLIFGHSLAVHNKYCSVSEGMVLSELILKTKERLDPMNKTRFFRAGKTISKEAIRSLIYLVIPIYFNVKQVRSAKIISLTKDAEEFLLWMLKETTNKKGKRVSNSLHWFKLGKKQPSSNNKIKKKSKNKSPIHIKSQTKHKKLVIHNWLAKTNHSHKKNKNEL